MLAPYLTKSRFKLALECPAKLYYGQHKEYANTKLEDSFLAALAEGGFQVGELAKLYFQGGHEIEGLDYERSLRQTRELMLLEEVTIYEAAFQFEHLFIRADIVRKKGNRLYLYEVKAKSIRRGEDGFLNKNGIVPKWKPYLMDIAFQRYVVHNEYPQFEISSYLLLADKSATASVDGLNQLFFLEDAGGRKKVKVNQRAYTADLGNPILHAEAVDEIVDAIWTNQHTDQPFVDLIQEYSKHLRNDERIWVRLGAKCGKCEFKVIANWQDSTSVSGFHECWRKQANFSPADFDKPSLLDVWDFKRKEAYVLEGKFFQTDLSRADLEPKNPSKKTAVPGLSRVDRQTLQIEKSNTGDLTHFIDTDNLRLAMASCIFPLHFIDFETTSVAIPFHAGRRPYEQMAFQFSHHIMEADGSVRHAGEWIHMEVGQFPNFDFIRALKTDLETDSGTIFRYSHHENNILNAIYDQLGNSGEADRVELMDWIQTITHSTSDRLPAWKGQRDMVDLWDWVKKYYYDPATKGSNSIKAVLPAVLSSSKYLQEKYGQPIYGTEIVSRNYHQHQWLQRDEQGGIKSPYKTLPLIHEGWDNESLDDLVTDEEAGIFDGGAAMVAYARMQFTEMNEPERQRIQQALLRYCELDTLAMVMIWEAWREWCR